MKKIAIVAGGNSGEHDVFYPGKLELRHAPGECVEYDLRPGGPGNSSALYEKSRPECFSRQLA